MDSGRNPDGKAVSIRRNAWDAWKGYISGRYVETFGSSSTQSAEEVARKWLERQICPVHYQDNQGLCHRCGKLMEPQLWNEYIGNSSQ